MHLAVWDFLHRLGYRLHFLTDPWEIIPSNAEAKVGLDSFERPDYVTRQAPHDATRGDRKLQAHWEVRNRITSTFLLSTSHAYGRVFAANKEAFAAHAEYFALVNGRRGSIGATLAYAKVCVSNPGLRKLFVDYAVKTLRADLAMQSISLDPSDGGNWCESRVQGRCGSSINLPTRASATGVSLHGCKGHKPDAKDQVCLLPLAT